jgi:peroxiredoxin
LTGENGPSESDTDQPERPMKYFTASLPYAAALAVVIFIVRAGIAPAPPIPAVRAAEPSPPEDHLVTPEKLAAAQSLAGTAAPAFGGAAPEGRPPAPEGSARDKPRVLVFIQDGCPCSEAAQPYFNRLHAAHRGRVDFAGVISEDATAARRWAGENDVLFPVVADPGLVVVRKYKAENSLHIVLVAPGGEIEKAWPGYSESMLRELDRRLSRLTGAEKPPVSFIGAPAELYSGCPY